jgi:hypothetical protein
MVILQQSFNHEGGGSIALPVLVILAYIFYALKRDKNG